MLVVLFLLIGSFAFAEDWYISNGTGLALEKTLNKAKALFADWGLSVAKKTPEDAPENLKEYCEEGFSVEQRILYKKGREYRRQWIFRDANKTTRLNASFAFVAQPGAEPETAAEAEGVLPSGDAQNEIERLPFIELFDGDGNITLLLHLGKNKTVYASRFVYRNGLLAQSETEEGGRILWTDRYLYNRKNKLRRIERTFPPLEEKSDAEESGAPSPETTEKKSPEAPHPALSVSFPPPLTFISLESPYDWSLRTGALKDVFALRENKIVYQADSLGRIEREERLDEEGKVLSEIANEWADERIKTITWKAGDHSGRVEFQYNDKNERISEKDFRNGAIERTVEKTGDSETEELYLNGKVVLRAVWENGRKVSEERPGE